MFYLEDKFARIFLRPREFENGIVTYANACTVHLL